MDLRLPLTMVEPEDSAADEGKSRLSHGPTCRVFPSENMTCGAGVPMFKISSKMRPISYFNSNSISN